MLVAVRKLILHHVQDQLTKLPIEIREQLAMTGKIEGRLRQLERIDTTVISTRAGDYRLSWLLPLVDEDREMRRFQIEMVQNPQAEVTDEQRNKAVTALDAKE